MKGSKEDRPVDSRPNTGTEHTEMQRVTAAAGSSLAHGNGQEHQKSNTNGTFTLFGKLPLELRLMVWAMALPGPRCLESATLERNTPNEVRWELVNYDKSPAMLFVSWEPRAFALQHFQAPTSENSLHYHRVRYFNPSTDLLFNRNLSGPNRLDIVAFISERIPRLSRLALRLYEFRPIAGFYVRSLAKFSCLKELVVIPIFYESIPFKKNFSVETFDKENCNLPALSGLLACWLDFEAVKNTLTEMEKSSSGGWRAPKLRIGECVTKAE